MDEARRDMTATERALFSVLRFALGKERAILAARSLVARYGSLSVMADTMIEDLEGTEGMTKKAAMLVKLCFHLGSRSQTDSFELGRVHTERQIEEYLIGLYLGLTNETVYMLLLDAKGRVIACEYMGEGTVIASDIYPRRLLETAIRKNAAAVILAHNHPRGVAEPSREDVMATEVIFNVMRTSGIKLLAHYTVAGGRIGKVPLD